VPESETLLALARDLALAHDRLTAEFALELETVWRRFERLVRSRTDITRRAVSLRLDLRRMMERAGYDALAIAASARLSDTIASIVRQAPTPGKIAALRAMVAEDLLGQGDAVANAVWRAVARRVLTTDTAADILADLADVLDREVKHVGTLYDTQVGVFSRQMEALATEPLPDSQPYLYAGPVDGRARDWCLDRVGRVYTRAEIDAMDNGQLPNTFLTAGGYNCRHRFMAVESRELRGLVGTTTRAAGYTDDVKRVREWKAKRKAS
jgi:hypothetical protein